MTPPNPYAQIEYHGRPMLNIDKAAVMLMEHHLGYEVTVVQAIGDAPASMGMHKDGRELDLADWDAERKNRVARDNIGVSYIRTEADGMAGHLHQGVIFESRTNQRGISPSGFLQIGAYDRGENGLANHAADRVSYRPSPKVCITRAQYEFVITGGLELPQPNAVTRMRDGMVEAMHDLTLAIHEGKQAKDERASVRDAVADLVQHRREIRERLEKMPKR